MKARDLKLGAWTVVVMVAMLTMSAAEARAATTDLTYYGRVGRLLQDKCMQCHHVGGIAPFSMETYEDTLSHATDMKDETTDGTMPPWNASKNLEYNPDSQQFFEGTVPGGGFVHNRSLNAEQIQLISDWVEANAPAGDPSDARPNPVFNDEWDNGEPDAVLTQPVPWTLNPGDDDIYRCFVLPTGFTEDKIMTGMEVKPSNNKIAHHAILFVDPFNNGPARDALEDGPTDGWTCFGGSDLDGTLVVGGWAPGGNLQPFDENLGVPIPAGSNIIVQMHYSPLKVQAPYSETDQTQIGLKLSSDPDVQQLLQVPPTRLDFVIPTDALDYPINMEFTMPFDVHLVGVFPHMHLSGTDMRVTAKKPGLTTQPFGLINVDKWNFDWQNHYIYNDPIALPAGTVLTIKGLYDNFTGGPVYGGERSSDEMLLLGLSFTTDAALPGLGQGGIPPSHDKTPPTIIGSTVERGSTKVTIEFSEPIQPVSIPGDFDMLNELSQRIPFTNFWQDGNKVVIYWEDLALGDYLIQINAFAGIRDLAGNYLDTNGNGVGGELDDDVVQGFSNIIPLGITRQPANQRVNQGESVIFGVELEGDLEDLSAQWKKTDFTGTTNVSGGNGTTIQLNSVTFFNNAFYYFTGSNPTGAVTSDFASLEVFSPPKSNSAAAVSHAIPATVLPGSNVPVGITMRNTSLLTWSQVQGYALAVISDPGGLFQGQTRIYFGNILDVVPHGSGTYTFESSILAPMAPGFYNVQFQMVEEFKEFFGPVVSATIEVGSVFEADFTNNDRGWISIEDLGEVTSSVGANGLCLGVPAAGDNMGRWRSPVSYAPLIQGNVLQVDMTMSTTQTDPNAIPLWEFLYQNSIVAGKGGLYGGSVWFLDGAGGANGIGRPNGLTQYRTYVFPNAGLTQQFQGVVDFANSPFAPANDDKNDMEFWFRILDYGSSGYGASADSGTICLKSIRVTRRSLAALRGGSSVVWDPAINTATHRAQTPEQAAEGLGTAVINNGAANATFGLLSGNIFDNGGLGWRKTMSAFNPAEPAAWARMNPVTWEDGRLYLASARIRSNVNGGVLPEGTDPVKAIFINIITATNELGGVNYTTRGGPGNMNLSASPRQTATTGGQAQEYIALLYSHNASDALAAGAQRLGMTVDLFNVPTIVGAANGADQLVVEDMSIERLAPVP